MDSHGKNNRSVADPMNGEERRGMILTKIVAANFTPSPLLNWTVSK